MNIILCPNNHHYDADEFDVCPHCPQNSSPVKKQTHEVREEADYFPTFTEKSKPKKKKSLLKSIFAFSQEDETITDSDFGSSKESEIPKVLYSSQNKDMETEFPIGLDAEADDGDFPKDNELFDKPIHANDKPKKAETEGYFTENRKFKEEPLKSDFINQKKEKQIEEKAEISKSLEENIKNVASRTEGKTLGYFVEKEKKKNVESEKKHTDFIEPVVGWIVAVEGPHFGESFTIFSGQNSIGRSSTNKIVISKDNSVSREKHAYLIYDPIGLNFYLKAGESSGLVYLNKECIFGVRKLSEKDEIMIGESKFVFIPLCDNSFSWESYLERK